MFGGNQFVTKVEFLKLRHVLAAYRLYLWQRKSSLFYFIRKITCIMRLVIAPSELYLLLKCGFRLAQCPVFVLLA